MKFRTEINLPQYPFTIQHSDPIYLIGSCFTDHIGSYFSRTGFQTLSNPFGVLFNPMSIANSLSFSFIENFEAEKWCYRFQDKWISFAHHGKFSHPDKTLFLTSLQQSYQQSRQFLQQCHYLFITFGTSYCYQWNKEGFVVANCHKIPANQFTKTRLTTEQIVETYQLLINKLLQFNPLLKIIFTISPVRHLGDGLHENQLSKSILLLSTDQLIDNKNIFYFPAYEIVNDDLRDYRFYGQDLCHPAENAIEYVEEKVAQSFFNAATTEIVKANEKKYKQSKHIPL